MLYVLIYNETQWQGMRPLSLSQAVKKNKMEKSDIWGEGSGKMVAAAV